MTYLDITFCTAKCKNYECFRNLTQEVIDKANRFYYPDSARFCVSDFSKTCLVYIPNEDSKDKRINKPNSRLDITD